MMQENHKSNENDNEGQVVNTGVVNWWVRKVQRSGGQYFLAFPEPLRDQLGLVRGTICSLRIEDGELRIRPITSKELQITEGPR